ncbi:tail fiber domain-containing protein [Flavobacterium capsici]|uniref:Tail fiber domain-containing protein n=1 Tax=Flavobacterium capsici TaxID=3075618 RepID=A0AA96F238_9FLAO|nr:MULTISPECIES: tail fiber domain-containing protein [unclassified Flavobacterium]WNM19820.1 tail fiber domain-containing protein [Flavobacterium sp. PMR2A8]WNM21209.1 tail fiber domain-containing protein [Flavobacterium sp. PMTSA4]
MKKIYLLLFFPMMVFSQVGINTTTPNAQLDIQSSNQATPANTDGLLIPKINAFPATNPTVAQQGMLVYLTEAIGSNTPGFYYWDNLSVSWISIGDTINSSGWKLNGNSISGTDFLGTTNNQDLNFKRDNTEAGFIGASQTALGIEALNNLTSGFANNAFGLNALRNNSSGNSNNAFGNDALSLNTTGSFNSAFGNFSLKNNSASNNSAFGNLTLTNNTTGTENTAIGNSALATNNIGSNNVAVGFESQLTTTSGISNTAIGHSSMNNNTSGAFNTAVGTQSLTGNSTGLFNSAFGYQANINSANLMNATAIGAQALVASNNAMVLGSIQGVNGAFSSVNVGIGTTTPQDRLHVEGNIRMVDGNEAMGRVLTSDANGTASWSDFTNLASGTLDQAYDFGGSGNGKMITADSGAVTIAGTDGLVSTGTLGSGTLAPSGIGTRMVWNPRKAAFRAGTVTVGGSSVWDDSSIGIGSTALGHRTLASGQYSTAFGDLAEATGYASTSFGGQSIASGNYSTAFGIGNSASAELSVAFGNGAVASGIRSTAFGTSNTASGFSSTAFGQGNEARSYSETVIGIGATTYTPSTNGATLFRTSNATDRLFVIGNAIDSNNNNSVDVAERSDAMIVLKNGLTRLPSTTNTMIDAADGKAVVTKEYLQSNSSGTLDQAYDFGGAGNGNTITADTGAVLINGTDGLVSTGTLNSGALAPTGAGVKMFWNPRKASFRAGNIIGTEWDDLNIGNVSVAFGTRTTASGNSSVAFGSNTTASGTISTSFGEITTASGSVATAFGRNTVASGNFSTVFGLGSTASGNTSTAFGSGSTASGITSTSFGGGTFAFGSFSTAFGRSNSASSYGEIVIGIGATNYTPSTNGDTQFRAANATDRLFVIGNAIDADNDNNISTAERSDAMIVLKNGLTRLPSTTNTMIDAADGKAIATKEWVQSNGSIASWTLQGNSGTDSTTNFIGTTDATTLNLRTNNTDRMKLLSNGNIEIGGASIPSLFETGTSKLLVGSESSTTDNLTVWAAHSTAAGRTTLNLARQRGSFSSSLPVSNGDGLGELVFSGYSNFVGSHLNAAMIFADVDGTLAAANVPAKLGFSTAPDTGGSPIERMTIRANGNLGIGTSTPLEKLQVAGKALFTNGFSSDNGALLYKNNTDYMFIGPQSGSTSNGGGLALFGSSNNTSGNPGGMDINVPTGSVRLFHSNGSYTFSTSSTSNYSGLFELNDIGFDIGHNSISRAIIFSPGSTERMRLTPGGFLGVGATAPARRLHVSNGVSGGTSNGNTGILLESSGNVYQHFLTPSTSENGLLFGSELASINGGIIFNNSAVANGIQFRTGGNSNRMTITSAGNVGIGTTTPAGQLQLSTDDARKSGTSTWTIVSDTRLKNIKGNYTSGLNEILQLHPVRYQYKNNGERKFEEEVLDTEYSGFIAQEVQTLFPEAVGTDEDGYLNLNIHPILIASVNAFKELNTKYEDLKTENEDLKSKLELLLKRIETLEKK